MIIKTGKMQRIIEIYKSSSIQVKASIWFLLCTIVQRSITIITTPFYTRILTTYEYGEYNLFQSWMGILSCFVTMSISATIYPQLIVKFEDDRWKYSSALQSLTFVLIAIWVIVYIFFQKIVNAALALTTSEIAAMFLIMWMNSVFGFWAAEQRIFYRYKKLLLITLTEAILQPVLSIAFAMHSSHHVNGLVWGIALAMCISYASLFIAQLIKGRVFYSKSIWMHALRLAIPLIPHYLSSILLNSSDRIMIEKLMNESYAGLYSLAYTISICGVLINQAVLQSLSPWLLRKIKYRDYFEIKRVAYPSLVVIAITNIIIIAIAPEIVGLFAPSTYYDAIWVMPPISLSVYFMFMYNLFATFEFYYEKTSYVSIATGICAGANIILNALLIPVFGYYAAGYTTLFSYALFAFIHGMFMHRICDAEGIKCEIYNIRVLLMITTIMLISGFALMFTYKYRILRYGIIGSGIFLILVNFNRIFTFARDKYMTISQS